MNWLLLEELRNAEFSVINFGAGSQLSVVFKGSKGETLEFAGLCVATKAKSPCVNYTIRKCYADTYVERKFSFVANAPRLQLRVKAVKKAEFKRARLRRR